MVGRSDEMRAHPPGVDGRSLPLEVGDEVLVELVGGHDERVVETGLGEHAIGRLAEPGEVPGVETDGGARRPSGRAQLFEHSECVGQSRRQRVVRVHQEDGLGVAVRVGAKGAEFVLEAHHPGMGVRAPHRYAVDLPGEHVGRAVRPPDVGRPRAAEPAVRALRAPKPELHQRVVPAGLADARRLRRYEGLIVERVEDGRLQQLRLDERSLHLHDRLVGEHHRPFGHRLDGAVRPEVAQVVDEGPVEDAQPGKVGEILLGEAQVLHQVEEGLQPGRHREAVVGREIAEHVVETGRDVLAARLQVAAHHGELVEVGQQRKVLAQGPALRSVQWRVSPHGAAGCRRGRSRQRASPRSPPAWPTPPPSLRRLPCRRKPGPSCPPPHPVPRP